MRAPAPASALATALTLLAMGCDEAPDAGASAEAGRSPAVAEEGEVRVYVADRYEGVLRIDPNTLAVLHTIDTGPRPHGLIVSPDRRWLYITVETSNELLEVDLATDAITRRVEVGPVPNEPTITADGRYVFVPSRGGDSTDVVDVRAMRVVKRLPVGREEHNAYTSPDGSLVYVTSMGEDLVAVVDPERLEILRRIPVGGTPRPLALTRDNRTAYVALSGLHGFVALDLETDEIVDRVEIPVPQDRPRPLLDTWTHGLQLSHDERELWVASYGTDRVFAFTVPDLEPLADIVVGEGPHWFTLHPDGEPLYVTLEREGAVAAVHRGLRTVQTVRPVGQGPTRILAFRTTVDSP